MSVHAKLGEKSDGLRLQTIVLTPNDWVNTLLSLTLASSLVPELIISEEMAGEL
ncbi:MAG: hypothetical protein WCG98_02070 [bacterium]